MQLHDQIQQIARAARGPVGVAAALLGAGEMGKSAVPVTLQPVQRFPMQSVYKLPIGMAVLRHVDTGALRLEQKARVLPDDFVTARQHSPIRDRHPKGAKLSVGELLRFMVSESDGTACDVLLRLIGGPSGVMGYLRELGISGVVVANTEKQIGQDESVQYRNWSTPAAMLDLLRALNGGRGLSRSGRALLLRHMTQTSTGPRRIKGLLPAGAIAAHKTGTSHTVKGRTAATNDVGIVTLPSGRRLALAIFVRDSPADEATREGVIARIARAAWDHWQA